MSEYIIKSGPNEFKMKLVQVAPDTEAVIEITMTHAEHPVITQRFDRTDLDILRHNLDRIIAQVHYREYMGALGNQNLNLMPAQQGMRPID